MAPSLIASYLAKTSSAGTAALSTPSFTPANGEVIVVKLATWDTGVAMGAPTGGSQTYSSRIIVAPGGFRPWVGIYTTVISGSPGSMTISSTPAASAQYSMCVERWSSASLAATPVTNSGGTTNGGSGAAASSLTTSAANSVISWVAGDSQSLDPATRAYLGSATDEGVRDGHVGSNGVDYYAWANVAAAGSTSFGLSAPTGMQWDIAGIEILDAGGSAAPAYPPARPARRQVPRPPRSSARIAAPAGTQVNVPVSGNGQRGSRALRALLPRRARTATPVPAQVVVTPPAYPPASVRARLRGLRLFRPRTAAPVPAQIVVVAPAYPVRPVGPRARMLRLFRGRVAMPAPVQAAPAVPAQRPRFRLPRIFRGRSTAPATAQVVPPAAAHPRSHPMAPRRAHAAMPVPPQVAAVPPPYVPGLTRAKKRLARIFRGAARFVPPASTAPVVQPRTPTVTVDLARATAVADLVRTTATADLTRPSVTVAL